MANIPTRNNNPGDLRDQKTGSFKTFSDPQQGFEALKNDLNAKITGNTSTGLNSKSSIKDFASKYAPDSDGNNSSQYAENLAKKLGVTSDTPIGSLSNRLDDFASAIADNEGYQGKRVLGTTSSASPAQSISGGKLSPEAFAQKIKAKYPQYSDISDSDLTQKILTKYPQYNDMVEGSDTGSSKKPGTFDDLISQQKTDSSSSKQPNLVQSATGANPNDSLYGQLLDNNVTGAIKGVGNFLTGGGTGELGNEVGGSLAKLKEYGSGLLGGQNNAKYIEQPSVGNALAGAGKTIAGAVSTAIPGIISGARSPLLAKEIAYNIPMEMSEFTKLGNTEKLNVLGEALKTAETGDAGKIAEAIKFLKPGPSFLAKIAKAGISKAASVALEAAGLGGAYALYNKYVK
jgi:hypothetical protein